MLTGRWRGSERCLADEQRQRGQPGIDAAGAQRLTQALPQCQINTTEALGVHPDWVEAMAFAWLAYAYDMRLPGNVPAVTGARQAVVLGLEFLHC